MKSYNNTPVSRVLIKLDKIGNWLAGGNIEHTISARIGRYTLVKNGTHPLWDLLEAIVNLSFYPVDGPLHCKQAYRYEIKQDNTDDFKKGVGIPQLILTLLVILFCVPISLTLWVRQVVLKIIIKASS